MDIKLSQANLALINKQKMQAQTQVQTQNTTTPITPTDNKNKKAISFKSLALIGAGIVGVATLYTIINKPSKLQTHYDMLNDSINIQEGAQKIQDEGKEILKKCKQILEDVKKIAEKAKEAGYADISDETTEFEFEEVGGEKILKKITEYYAEGIFPEEKILSRESIFNQDGSLEAVILTHEDETFDLLSERTIEFGRKIDKDDNKVISKIFNFTASGDLESYLEDCIRCKIKSEDKYRKIAKKYEFNDKKLNSYTEDYILNKAENYETAKTHIKYRNGKIIECSKDFDYKTNLGEITIILKDDEFFYIQNGKTYNMNGKLVEEKDLKLKDDSIKDNLAEEGSEYDVFEDDFLEDNFLEDD